MRIDKTKPNIIFILSDDQGAWAMGCSGNHEIRTPNLDRLAETGMRFENFFCTSPVCSPARASILTGSIPSQHGVHDWIGGGNIGKDSIEYLHGQPGYTDYLAQNGYVCALSGKWHLGDSVNPQKSFSHWYVHQKGGGSYYDAPMIVDGTLINEEGYITDNITNRALKYLDELNNEEAPFYISIHYTAPHDPWINCHPKDIVDSYDDCKFETCPQEELQPEYTSTGLTSDVKDNIRENLKGYYASITAMDLNIGRIIDKVEELGVREDTLICFMSDNGLSCGQNGFWGKGNGTFPLNMYETSVKVPAIFSQPTKIPEGLVCDDLLSQYDFMPTLLEYVGIGNSEDHNLPGQSFYKLLVGDKMTKKDHVVVYDEYGPVRMVRSKTQKYVHRYPYGPHEFFDLVNDPNERVNLINDSTYEKNVVKMKSQLDRWFIKYVDPYKDGTHEGVTGNGQYDLPGPAGKGNKAFR